MHVRNELLAAGLAEQHHAPPDSAWVRCHLREPGDVERAIELLCLSYELTLKQRPRLSRVERPGDLTRA